ncbi:MAG TPA: uroporphyrinogen decarboxylase family protein [Anaerolineaceae bacterium]
METTVFYSPDEARQRLIDAHFRQPGKMTPYERVAAALDLRQPDQVPFDFWAVPETIAKLTQYLQVSSEEELLQLLGVDCRVFHPEYIGPEPEMLPDGSFYSPWGSHRREVRNEFSTYHEYASYPLENAQNAADVETWERWPKPEYYDWASLPDRIRAVNAPVRHHIRVDIGGIFESAWALYGLERFLTDLIEKPEVPCAIMDCYTDIMIANTHRLMAAAGGLVDWVYTYDDVAMQNGLLMSPAMWRKYILPRHLRLNAAIKQYPLKILYHSCGAIFPLIAPLIDEMGIDALNPLQPRARWMDMAKIKAQYGERIAFHGGIDLQHTLPYGTPQEVAQEVRDRCNILGRGGGYICTSAHYIQADVPVENILTMYLTDRTVED